MTDAEREIRDYIECHQPVGRLQIQAWWGASPSTVNAHLQSLRKQGQIRCTTRNRHGLWVIVPPDEVEPEPPPPKAMDPIEQAASVWIYADRIASAAKRKR